MAADLLSRLSTAPDSQVVLVTHLTALSLADAIGDELKGAAGAAQPLRHRRQGAGRQPGDPLATIWMGPAPSPTPMPRKHLIRADRGAEGAAGQSSRMPAPIFLGAWTPESVGITPAATSHPCPPRLRPAPARAWGSPTIQRRYTVQELKCGRDPRPGSTSSSASPEAEGLDAHKNAVTLRLNALAKGFIVSIANLARRVVQALTPISPHAASVAGPRLAQRQRGAAGLPFTVEGSRLEPLPGVPAGRGE